MDVKTTFLNGSLEEDIYMQQLEGFIARGQEHMPCKLQRSIYGLRQASGVAPHSRPDPFGGSEPSPGCSNIIKSPYQNHLSKTRRSVTL